jgi:hypothetical protein
MKAKPKQKKETNSAWPTFDSIASAAGAIGVEPSTLKKVKEAGCPAFKLGSRVSARDLLHWLLSANPKEANINWHARWKKAVAEREEIRLAKDRAEVIDRSNAHRGIAAGVSVLFTELERHFLSELPPTLVGLDALAIRRVSEKKIEGLRETLRTKFAEITD